MNYNEEFKRNILIKLAENININFENQQSVERILVELLQDYTTTNTAITGTKGITFGTGDVISFEIIKLETI